MKKEEKKVGGKGVKCTKKNKPGFEKSNHQVKLDSLDLIKLTPTLDIKAVFQIEDNELSLNWS